MKLVAVSADLFDKYSFDRGILCKSTRPYVLVIRLSYKNRKVDFAVPIRSNIPASAPKNQYFALPPRPQTKPRNRHGLHYIKMFPILKQYQRRYRTEGNNQAVLIQSIIDKNCKRIVTECQQYLDSYQEGIHPKYSTDIERMLDALFSNH